MRTTKIGSLNVHISEHSVMRYKERIMTHRRWDLNESIQKTCIKICREIDPRNILKVVNYGDDYKFIFTKKNTEFRFEKSSDKTAWILVTCVRYLRLMPSEEPLHISDIRKGKPYGIRTAIKIREKNKEKYEKKKLSEQTIKEEML